MRKIKEVLRLKFEVGLGLRAIARSCSIGLGTAHEYLQRAEAAKITWPLGPEWDDDRLEAALFGGPGYLVVATAAGWSVSGFAAFCAVAAFVAGFAILVLRMHEPCPGGPDDGDDGAVV